MVTRLKFGSAGKASAPCGANLFECSVFQPSGSQSGVLFRDYAVDTQNWQTVKKTRKTRNPWQLSRGKMKRKALAAVSASRSVRRGGGLRWCPPDSRDRRGSLRDLARARPAGVPKEEKRRLRQGGKEAEVDGLEHVRCRKRFGICSCAKCACNSLAICTYKIIGLKPSWNEHLQKSREGLPLLASLLPCFLASALFHCSLLQRRRSKMSDRKSVV